ncbi:MAG: helix-turn-helix transcriptional regulator [Geodermatophilaceae bacterium]
MVTTASVPTDLLPHLRRVHDRLDLAYAESHDLDALAKQAATSKYHFVRCFAAAYGETPMRYLTRRRIERAQDLLRATNLTVTEICQLVGYASLGTFSTRFRELVGMSPTQYQREQDHGGAHRIPGCVVFMLGMQRISAISEKSERPVGT